MNLKSLKELFWWWSGKQTWCQEPLNLVTLFVFLYEEKQDLNPLFLIVIIELSLICFLRRRGQTNLMVEKEHCPKIELLRALMAFYLWLELLSRFFYIFYFGLFIIFRGLITLFAIGHAVKFILYGFELWHPSSLKKNLGHQTRILFYEPFYAKQAHFVI